MVRSYLEVYSKGNECFLRSETIARQGNVADEVKYMQKYCAKEDTITVIVQTDNYAVLKVESADFIEIRTFSTI